MLLVVDLKEVLQNDYVLVDIIKKTKSPLFLVLNKVDISNSELIQEKTNFWKKHASFEEIFQISALHKTGTAELLEKIKEKMPLGPAYYPKDQFTDRSERFFVSEIIREKILLLYHQEIPYASEVVVETFKDDPDPARKLVRILAHIFVSRKTQKGILIGDKGSSIKKLGIESRIDIEKFLEKKVHLELYVKVKEDWRDDDKLLKSFGYEE
jgi:GTP-binding protein Era